MTCDPNACDLGVIVTKSYELCHTKINADEFRQTIDTPTKNSMIREQ